MIIGITGKKGVGKTTMATHIAARYGGFKVFSFSKTLKYALSYLTGIDVSHFLSPKKKETPLDDWNYMTPRKMMQLFGTEVARHIHTDFWLKSAEYHIPKGDVIIDDVRFANEADWIKKQGGLIVKIIGGPPRTDDHSSESLFGVYPDHQIENKFNDENDTTQAFYNKIDHFMSSIYSEEA